MNPLLLNHIISFSLIAITLPTVAAFVFFSRPRNILNQVFAIYSFSIAWWAFFTIFMLFSVTTGQGLFWDRMCLTGVVFIPSTLLHFISVYTKDDKRLRVIIVFNYIVSFIFLIILWMTQLFVFGVQPKFGMEYFTIPGPVYAFYVSFFVFTVVLALMRLWRFAKQAPHLKVRKQATLLFWFSLIGYTGGCCNYLLVYNISLPGFAETANYGILLHWLMVVYIIFRYRFMDIEVIVKRTLVFAGLFAIVMGIVAVVTAISQELIGRYLRLPSMFSAVLSVVFAIFLYDPSRKLLVHLTDRYLFQKKESIKVILNRLSQSIITILDIDKVGETILSTLRNSLRLESGAIIIKKEDGQGYFILDSFDINRKATEYPENNLLITYLKERADIINMEHEQTRKDLPPAIIEAVAELKSVLLIPLFLHNELIGILSLGKKKSDEDFTPDELDYLPTVSSQVAISLSNARLYDILKKSQIDFAQQAKMASIGTLSAGISHEVKNPLSIIRNGLELLKFNKKMGVYQTMTKEDFEKAVFEVVEAGIKNVDRATGVINRLSSFAKKPKEIQIQPVSIRQCLDNAHSLLSKEFENYGIALEKTIPHDFPLVMADPIQMEDILVNLMVNARHAIREKGRITVRGSFDDKEAEIIVEDTGPGIEKENLGKIFDPFFTTKDTSRNPDPNAVTGSGLGLFLVREFIRRFGGRIMVDSEIGKGTAFHIFLPVADKN